MNTETNTKHEERWVRSCCSNCYAGNCPIKVHVVDGVVTKVEGDLDAPLFRGKICAKGNAAVIQLYDPYRLKAPLKRTNPKKGIGVDPQWAEITWEEAMDTLADKLSEVREKNPARFNIGGMDVHMLTILKALPRAFGGNSSIYFTGSGPVCGNPVHVMGIPLHGSVEDMPDLRHTRYLINIGGSLGESWMAPTIQPQLMAEGREKRGLKVVVVDPRQTHLGAKADEWIPIRPATDGALFLAMMHVLVHELGQFDREFLKRQTNACYLIGDDGYPLRDAETGKPVVWDSVEEKVKTYDDSTIKDVAMEGSYRMEVATHVSNPGPPVGKPAFQLFKDHIRQYTPEWAAELTTIPGSTIRRLSKEIVEAAQIGTTVMMDGKEYAFRPVAVVGYRGLCSHTNSPSTEHARMVLNMLLGSNRSPGGVAAFEHPGTMGMRWPDTPFHSREDGLTMGHFSHEVKVPWEFPFKDVGMTQLYPVAYQGSHLPLLGQVAPEKYGVDKDYLCEVLIHSRLNPLMHVQDPKVVAEGLAKVPFYVRFATFLDESCELADLVLPDTTHLERMLVGNYTWYLEGINLQQPVVSPLYNSRPSAEVCWELGKRLGILTGPMGMQMMMNFSALNFAPPWILDPEREYTYEEYVDATCKAFWGKDLAWFKEHGHNLKEVPPDRYYYRWGWNQCRLPFYWNKLKEDGETLRRNMERDKVKEKVGLDPDYWCSQYNPMPVWTPSVIHRENSKYDLYAFSFKTNISTHSTFPMTNPWLAEIAERDAYFLKLWINAETAKKKGLGDDDLVWVESEVGRIQGRVKLSECIHHECLGFSGNNGHWMKHPLAQGKGSHLSSLLPFDLDHAAPVAVASEMAARVRIYKA